MNNKITNIKIITSQNILKHYEYIFPSTIYCLFIMRILLGNIVAMAPYSNYNPIIF
jgi:hypothetical protein